MPLSKRRVLCAEANKDIADLISLMLTEKGYEVRAVHTAADCLQAATVEQFDLYILNDEYIDADSIELCQKLRAFDPVTPLLLFSLETSGHKRADALKAGAHSFVTKTSDFVMLVQTIDTLLQSR